MVYDIRHIDHPAAWKAADIGSAAPFAIELEERHLRVLDKALNHARNQDRANEELSHDDFPLHDIAQDLEAWRQQLTEGPGLLWLRGLPVTEYSVEDWEYLFLGLGRHLGLPVSQSNLGELVGHVINVGGQDRRERAYRNNRPLDLHTDRCDYIGMLCLEKAKSGGVSGYASAVAVHNEIMRRKPALLEPLYEGFKLHRFGEQPPGEPPITSQKIPIFSVKDNYPNVIYIRGYINLAIQEGFYELTDVEQEALDTFDEIAASDEFCLNMTLEPGEATFTNNCMLLHRRTTFEDHTEPERRRHLLRLWLSDPQRPADDRVRAHKTSRGIEKRDDGGTYYRGPGWTKDDAY
ncbi:MAG: taurine catabolism dioxygenase TauD [Thiotrichales bacterium]|nr:taurine catabolism dioxygenase TauD [Thiotrichales bacterium]|tara:strand:- start:48 stop:1094 length:1047 start_codon:yes stop_codon:yes gene_type:complete